MPMIIPDKICLYFMIKENERTKREVFTIPELEKFSWKVVERRNRLNDVVDYIMIVDDYDKEVFETFSARLKDFCKINTKIVGLKTDKETLKLAGKFVESLDDVTKQCCDEILNRQANKEISKTNKKSKGKEKV